ncbi:hypothetical protein R1sor_025232 [Riccia sorocarpa]|uniref:Reverse transcriptase domain-containing protein n=1 Tax=Riccia sorocarpa TaxID=122646 RepID=A0ABD3GA09_9MARC
MISREIVLLSAVRQGCPLAPLLYALATVPLIKLLFTEVHRSNLQAILIVEGSPVIVSLFADDTAMFLPLDQHCFEVFHKILRVFCEATTSRINFDKSQIVPIGAHVNLPDWVHHTQYQVTNPGQPVKYLGFWFGAESQRSQVWSAVIASISRRIAAFDDQLLSFEGRVVLLRAIVAAIPLYTLAFSFMDAEQKFQRLSTTGQIQPSMESIMEFARMDQVLEGSVIVVYSNARTLLDLAFSISCFLHW